MDTETKQKYKDDFNFLTQLLNSFDPCDLISEGAPLDEYNSLTHKILSSIYSKRSRPELKDLILKEITIAFGNPDLNTLNSKYKNKFNQELEEFLNCLEEKFYKM